MTETKLFIRTGLVCGGIAAAAGVLPLAALCFGAAGAVAIAFRGGES